MALTPMLQQYIDIKKEHPDCLIFFRLGDFYELFFEDAQTAAPILGVQLTARDKKSQTPVPMCGIPFHAAETYLKKILRSSLKVALCEQIGDPAQTKGILERKVTQILTPSLIPNPDWIDENDSPTLLILQENKDSTFNMGLFELCTGELLVEHRISEVKIFELTQNSSVKEILTHTSLNEHDWFQPWNRSLHEPLQTFRDTFFEGELDLEQICIRYLKETHLMEQFLHLKKQKKLSSQETAYLPSQTIKNLEIFESQSLGSQGPTLFSLVNKTKTAMGRRCLKRWFSFPCINEEEIKSRHEAIAELLAPPSPIDTARKWLSAMRDLERLSTKISLKHFYPKDVHTLRQTLESITELKKRLTPLKSKWISQRIQQLNPLLELSTHISESFLETLPVNDRDGGIFLESSHSLIKELRTLSDQSQVLLDELETQERQKTSVPNLKIKFSRVFGYTFEISKNHLTKVPEHYVRKQTLTQAERFVTSELKELEDKILSASEKLKNLEQSLFKEFLKKLEPLIPTLQKNAHILGEIDSLINFAYVSRTLNYNQPQISQNQELIISQGRHPVIESTLKDKPFIPNDITFDSNTQTILITGPNMGGKSTLMRQTALICLLNQVGCFVPAETASLPILSGIYTRIGSGDDIIGGQSTFMVEMSEMNQIIQSADSKSLILIDEIGRGTSTYDGLSLAWSLLEHLHNKIQAKTFFATHFHELTQLEAHYPTLKNFHVSAKEWKNQIIFLHQFKPGAANRSYGIEVAKLAGLPHSVTQKALKLLKSLTSSTKRNQKTLEKHEIPRPQNIETNQQVLF